MAASLADARALDAADPLRGRRDRFILPEGVIYLDGNSLGALPAATPARVRAAVETEWGQGLIRSWNDHDWIGAPARLGAKIARLIGAEADEVIVANSTSVNLFKLIAAALPAQAPRTVLLTESGGFPTEHYIAEGAAATLPGLTLRAVPPEAVADAIDASVAAVMLTDVHYKTGARHDMAALTRRAHEAGALVLWDLSHSTGAVEVDLAAANADLAVGCGYKFLNGGPGAPAFLYVARRHQAHLRSPLTGWMGHADPFTFAEGYEPAPGIERFLCGTPGILGMAALEAGLDEFADLDMAVLAAKGQQLCALSIELVEARCAGFGLTPATPRDPARRGSQVSLRHPHAFAIKQAPAERGVIGDFREPDILRLGFTPLYIGFEDAWRAVDILHGVLTSETWRQPRFQIRPRVT